MHSGTDVMQEGEAVFSSSHSKGNLASLLKQKQHFEVDTVFQGEYRAFYTNPFI